MGAATLIISFLAGGFALPAFAICVREAVSAPGSPRVAESRIALICLGVFIFSMFQIISRLGTLI